jgi:hypothetical protein
LSEYRAGYDVTEVAFLEEDVFGTKKTTGAFKPIPQVVLFDPQVNPTKRPKTGLGRQIAASIPTVKKNFDLQLNMELVTKSTSPAFEWNELFYYGLSNGAYGDTYSLTKRLKSITLGAKLDLATDQFWTCTGNKLNTMELGCPDITDVLKLNMGFFVQNAVFNETDYVSGALTRQGAVAANQPSLRLGDLDMELDSGGGYSSLISRVNSFNLRVDRTLQRRGNAASDKQLWAAFVEGRCNVVLAMNLDFNSINEYTQTVGDTEIDFKITIPDASGGRIITLSDGKFTRFRTPHREVELIAVPVELQFTDIGLTTEP